MKSIKHPVRTATSLRALREDTLEAIDGGHAPLTGSGQRSRTTPDGIEYIQWTPTSYQWTLTTPTGMQHFVWTPQSAQYSNAQAGALTPDGPVSPVHDGWTAIFGQQG